MAKGISIGIASDTREFASGVKKGIIDPLEDASDSLDELGKDGKKNGDKLERAFKDAQGEVSDFKKEQTELGRAMQKASKKGSDAWGDNSKKGFSKAEEAAEGFRDEATQNFAETASSFDGSMDSIADMAQGTLGGLATSISGPIGIGLAGVGAVAGATLTGIAADADKMAEDVSAAFDRMIEAGSRYMDAEMEAQLVRDAIDDEGKWRAINGIVDLTGMSVGEVARGIALGGDEAAKVRDRLQEILDKNRELSELDALSHAFDPALVNHYIGVLGGVDKSISEAEKKFRAYGEATGTGFSKMQMDADVAREKMMMLGRVPIKRTVVPAPDLSAVDRAIARDRRLNITVEAHTRTGKRIL